MQSNWNVRRAAWGTSVAAAFLAVAGAMAPVHADVTEQMIANDATTPDDVLTVGMGQSGQRFSPLKAINDTNVGELTPVWAFSLGGEKQRGQETQPLIYDGKMFITGSYSRIWALDARTGKRLWSYEYRLPDGIEPCCDVVNRGAALFGNLVIYGTLDAHLLALELRPVPRLGGRIGRDRAGPSPFAERAGRR